MPALDNAPNGERIDQCISIYQPPDVTDSSGYVVVDVHPLEPFAAEVSLANIHETETVYMGNAEFNLEMFVVPCSGLPDWIGPGEGVRRVIDGYVGGGVQPGKGGAEVDGFPVFNTVAEAVAATGANTSMVFVPPRFCSGAIIEAADAGIELIIAITEGVPVLDMVRVRKHIDALDGCRLVGPNCPGVITPGVAKIGIMPGYIHKPANVGGRNGRGRNVGIISRSGTLTYEAVWQCSERGLAQTTLVGNRGDPVKGLNFAELPDRFEHEPETHAI